MATLINQVKLVSRLIWILSTNINHTNIYVWKATFDQLTSNTAFWFAGDKPLTGASLTGGPPENMQHVQQKYILLSYDREKKQKPRKEKTQKLRSLEFPFNAIKC